jgi:hypothetical protein
MAEEADREIADLKARLAALEQKAAPAAPASPFSHLPSYYDASRAKVPDWRLFGLGAIAVLVVAGLLALVGVNPTEVSTASDSHVGMSDLEASLTACKDAYGAAIDALQGSDLASLRSTTDGAETSCHAAAAALRRTPLPGHPNAADGLDQTAEGFRELKSAVAMLDRTPSAAQRKARSATREIIAGMKKVES